MKPGKAHAVKIGDARFCARRKGDCATMLGVGRQYLAVVASEHAPVG